MSQCKKLVDVHPICKIHLLISPQEPSLPLPCYHSFLKSPNKIFMKILFLEIYSSFTEKKNKIIFKLLINKKNDIPCSLITHLYTRFHCSI